MTDRVSGFFVILEEDAREDDVRSLMESVRAFRHVADVKIGPAVPAIATIERTRLRRSIAEDVYNLIAGEKIL